MTFLKRLQRTAMAALLALLALAASLASVSAIVAALAETAVLGVGDSFTIVFAYTFFIGIIPVLCLGTPSYAWLWHKGWASWATAALLGMALGAPMFFADREFGILATLGGIAVAVATHAICRAGANNSFKPTPLCGSA
jgi:hypothetical protein